MGTVATRDECRFPDFWSSAAEGGAPPPEASHGGVASAAISAPDQKPRARARGRATAAGNQGTGGEKTHSAGVLRTDPVPHAGEEDNKGGLDELVADTNDASHERTPSARTAIDLHCYEPLMSSLRKDRARAFTQSDG